MLHKDDAEHPIPESLGSTFKRIVTAFVAGDFQLRDHPIADVRSIDSSTAEWIAENVSAYGDTLAPLSDEAWERSVYQWMDGYWVTIVDLSTTCETVSDLALHAKLYEVNGSLELGIYAVYVP